LGFLCLGLLRGRYGGWLRSFGCFAFGLEFAEFGGALVEQSMRLGAGTVHGFLDSRSVFVGGFHGIEDVILAVIETNDEVGFDFATAAEPPGGAMDFFHEDGFEETSRGQLPDKTSVKGRVAIFFAWPDKVAGEEAEGDGVFCGYGFSGI
jgi:hypothetical protein